MKTIEVVVSNGKVGGTVRTEFEIEDEATEEEIETAAHEAMHDLVEWSWKEKNE